MTSKWYFMSVDDLLGGAHVLSLEPSADDVKRVLQNRLAFAEKQSGFEPGSTIQVTDGAYCAIAEVSRCSPGLALEVFKLAMPSGKTGVTLPYVITEGHIRELGLTYESLCAHWDSPLRNAVVLHMER